MPRGAITTDGAATIIVIEHSLAANQSTLSSSPKNPMQHRRHSHKHNH